MNIFNLTDDEFTDDDLHKSEYGELLKISKYLTNYFGYFWFVNDEKVEDKMVIENLENSIIILVNFQYSEVIIINTETTKEVSTLFQQVSHLIKLLGFFFGISRKHNKNSRIADPNLVSRFCWKTRNHYICNGKNNDELKYQIH